MLTAALALPLALQLLGLNVLCFCGGCPASAILWPVAAAAQAEVHPCCRHAAELAAQLPAVQAQSCCGDDHAWRVPTAVTPDELVPTPLLHACALPFAVPPVPFQRQPSLRLPRQSLARGPPPVPLYLQHLSLQI